MEEKLKARVERITKGRPAQQGFEESVAVWDKYISKLNSRNIVLEIGVNTSGSAKLWQLMGFTSIIGVDKDWDLCLDLISRDADFYKIKGDSVSKQTIKDVEIDLIEAGIHHGLYDPLKQSKRPIINWVDMLHIDGDHSYEGCESDLLNYEKFVRLGGLILFHDCGRDPNAGPTKVFNNYKFKYNKNEIIYIDQNGMGVFVK